MPRPEGDDGSRTNARTPKNPTGKAAPKPAVTPTNPNPRKPTAKKPAPKKATTAPTAKPKAQAASAPATGGKTFTVDTFLTALKLQESGDYTNHHSGSSASGAYQYIDSTWNNYGGYAHAWQAPPAVQDARARADVTAAYKKYGGDWEKVAAAHFAGGGWVDAHPDKTTWGQNPVPGSKNPTVSRYVSSLFGHAGQAATSPTSGGGGTSGGAGGSTAGGVTTYQADSGESIQSYGFINAVAKSEPDLARLMQQYANQDVSDPAVAARLEADIQDTQWYKKHTKGERDQEVLKATDPTQYQTKYDAAQHQMQQSASKLGVTLNGESLARLTKHYLAEGWSEKQVNEFLLQFGNAKGAGAQTDIGTTTQALKEQASDYMVPLSDAALQKWTNQILTGQVTSDNFNSYLKEQAKSLFPGMAGAIDRGVTMKTYTDPYRNLAANTLEINPEDIDFMHDPKYQKALFQIDPKTKDRSAMSLADWGTYLRQLPEYGKTHQANQQAAAFGTSLATIFGKIAS